ncbi:MAG: TonB-dependent receptor [Spirochaetota bacterium]|nr:TonB-dependent receptor [Spirochaetota bacterium]
MGNLKLILWLFVFVFTISFPCFAQEIETEEKKKQEEEQVIEKEKKKGKVFDLEKVVVTGTRTPHMLKDVPVETIVITKEEIERSSALTITDLLRYTPGIFVKAEDTPGISGWKTKVRGLDFNSGYGLVLVDGQRVKTGGMGEYGYGLNQIPPEMIERIEIVKGPGSVLYGSDAMAGVVNIITKSTPEKTIYGCQAGGGTYATKIGSLYWGTKVDSFGMFLHASRDESEMGKYGSNETRDENYKRNRIDARFSYDLLQNLKFSLGLSGEEEDRVSKYLEKDLTSFKDHEKIRISPELKATFDDKSTLCVRGYYYDWNFKSKEYGEDSSGYTPTQGHMYYYDGEAQYSKPLWKNNIVTMGVEYLQEELDYNLSDKKIDVVSGYIQDEAEFIVWRPLKIVLGGRVDNHSYYGTEFCPKLSLMYVLTDKTRIRTSMGRAFKSPTIRQLHYNVPFQHGTYWFRSNPDLEAEKSLGYSLGIEQELGDRVIFDITCFRNDIKDKVLWVESGETIDELPVKTGENIAESRTQGVDVGLKTIIFKWLSVDLAYSYLDTEDLETNKELTYCPRHSIAGHLISEYKPWGITLNIGSQYISKMYKNSDNSEETEDYTLYDAKLICKLTSFASISVEGNNIFDSDYGEPDKDWWGPTWLFRIKMDF